MYRIFAMAFAIIVVNNCLAQTDIDLLKDSIEKEGQRLYRSEMASWYGTDILLEALKDKRKDFGGYFSYFVGDSTRCVFFDKSTTPLIMAGVTFDSSYNTKNAIVDARPRQLTPYERSLYDVRQAAFKQIKGDTLFKTYQNTMLNLIPFDDGANKKVYVLTGPEQNGVVVFGNDYLLTFDSNNNLVAERRLHKNIIMSEYGKNPDQVEMGGVHTHLPETGALITPTDICTLRLYEKFTKWQQYIVISESHVSIWDCAKNNFIVLTREAWDKIYGDKDKKHK